MAAPTTQYTGYTTGIPGLLFFDVTAIEDERGSFQEKFHLAKLEAAGLPAGFRVVQNSLSFNKVAGVTRGFHAEPWDKYISVVSGKVFAAYLDLRPGPAFGKIVTTEIGSTRTVFLPEGVANSFQTLVPDTNYLYSVNRHWRAEDYDKYQFVNLADPSLGVIWPISLGQAILSDRDKQHPMLQEIKGTPRV